MYLRGQKVVITQDEAPLEKGDVCVFIHALPNDEGAFLMSSEGNVEMPYYCIDHYLVYVSPLGHI